MNPVTVHAAKYINQQIKRLTNEPTTQHENQNTDNGPIIKKTNQPIRHP